MASTPAPSRRQLLRLCGAAGLTLAGGSWLAACASSSSTSSSTTTAPPTTPPPSVPAFTGYGPLGPPDANGLRLPAGFTARVVATSGESVAGTDYVWPIFPDGGATFASDDGGWIYVANSEVDAEGGGVSMVEFDADGTIVDARAIATGTSRNCAGGATPWGTWLTCEEVPTGIVYECDPTGARPARPHAAMGAFTHEAAAVDPEGKAVYLTEDQPDGGFYRFTPASYPDLSSGTLEVMTDTAGAIGWAAVPDPSGAAAPTRQQVAGTKIFNGGEGICYLDGAVYFTTKGDNSVRRYDPRTDALSVIYDAATSPTPELTGVDNITSTAAGRLYVAEDGGDMQIVMIDGDMVEAVVQVTGVEGSEVTGPAFSPDGARLYFSSQRNPGRTYEVTGPWRTT